MGRYLQRCGLHDGYPGPPVYHPTTIHTEGASFWEVESLAQIIGTSSETCEWSTTFIFAAAASSIVVGHWEVTHDTGQLSVCADASSHRSVPSPDHD